MIIFFGLPQDIADFIMLMSIKTVEQVNKAKQKLPEPKFERQEKIQSSMLLHHVHGDTPAGAGSN